MASMKRTGDGRYNVYTTKRDRLIHIETDKGIINIHLNLTETSWNSVTNISIMPDTTDGTGSPVDVVLDFGDKIQRESTSIRMILDRAKTYQKRLSDIIIAS